jgi:hypothetical protein
MPQLQNLVVNDRQATPVAHTFVPLDIDKNNVGTVVETTGVPIGNSRVTISSKVLPSQKHKARMTMAVPVVQTQTINGVSTPVVVRTAYADLTFTFDSTSSEAERNDIVGMLANSLDPSATLVNDAVVKLQGVY